MAYFCQSSGISEAARQSLDGLGQELKSELAGKLTRWGVQAKKSEYRFVDELLKNLISVGVGHWHCVKLFEQLCCPNETTPCRLGHHEESLAVSCHSKGFVRLQSIESLGLIASKLLGGNLLHCQISCQTI